MLRPQVVGSSVRLAVLRPKKGASGKGVAARYRPADNTMAVSFEDPRKRVKEPAIQRVGSTNHARNHKANNTVHSCGC